MYTRYSRIKLAGEYLEKPYNFSKKFVLIKIIGPNTTLHQRHIEYFRFFLSLRDLKKKTTIF